MSRSGFRSLIILLPGLLLPFYSSRAQTLTAGNSSSRRLALIVGNASYEEGRLRNPVNDAHAIQIALQKSGFQVVPIFNADRKELPKAVDRFVAELRRGDTALFYYSGHGMQLDGENYLVPVDFGGEDETEAKYVGYPMSRIQAALDRSGARTKILIFDACRDNPFRGIRSSTKGLAKVAVGAETFIAFATAPGMTAGDGSGENSPFTAALLRTLGLPGLTLDEVFNRVNEAVVKGSHNSQVPWHVSTIATPFYFLERDADKVSRLEGTRPSLTASNVTTNSKKAQTALEKGRSLMSDGKYAESIRILNESIRWDQNVAMAYAIRGNDELLLGQHEQAINDFKRFIALTSSDNVDASNFDKSDAYNSLGIAYSGKGDYDASIDMYYKALDINKSSAVAYSGLANDYAAIGQNARAIEAASRSIALDSTVQGTYFSRGIAYSEFGQHELAVQDFSQEILVDRARKDDPFNLSSLIVFASYLSRAISYSQLGMQQEAVSDVDEAIRLKPDAEFVYVARGEIRKNVGDCKTAIPDFERVAHIKTSGLELPTKLVPAFPVLSRHLSIGLDQQPLLDLAECYAKVGQSEKALASADEAIQRSPNERSYLTRGYVYAELRQYENAAQDYSRALEFSPDLARAYLERGRAYDNLGNCVRAIDDYTEAILLNPKDPWSFEDRSICFKKSGQLDMAISDADSALRLKPDFPDAFLNRGAAYYGLGKYALAVADYSEAIRLKPDYGLAFNNRAFAKLRLGDDKGAQEDFSRASELGYRANIRNMEYLEDATHKE